MPRWLNLALLLGLSVILPGAHAASPDKTLILATVNYPPYAIQNPQDDLKGIDVEIVEAGLTRAGYAVQVRFLPWKRAVADAQDGRVTGVISCGDSPQRRGHFTLSAPTSQATQVLIVRADYQGPIPERIEDFRKLDLQIAAVAGYDDEQQLTNADVPHFVVKSEALALRMLDAGRIGGFWSGLETARFLTGSLGLKGGFKYLRLQDRDAYLFHLCISRQWPNHAKIVADFDAALEAMRRAGDVDAILGRYQ